MPADPENPASTEDMKLERQEAQTRIAKLLAETDALKQQSSLSDRQSGLMVERLELDKRDAEARIAKIDLEKKVLSDQLTRASQLREWLKTLGTAAAILVFLWTVISGLQQLRDNLTSREEERFERAIVRISSEKPTGRLSGVVSLRDFLAPGPHASGALSYLANAMILEQDSSVRRAILEAITSLKTGELDRRTLNQTLETLVDGNRNLTQIAAKQSQSGYSYPNDPDLADRLRTISAAIVFLLKNRTEIRNLSGIYCVSCDFRGINLPGVIFDDAILSSAVFDNAILTNSSFENAVLTSTSFKGAHLNSAKFALTRDKQPGFAVEAFLHHQGFFPYGPNFNCADLQNADFSGQPFFGLVQESPGFTDPINAMVPELSNANLAKADFTRMGLYLVLKLPKGSIPQPIRLPRGASPTDMTRYLPPPTTPPPPLGMAIAARLSLHFTSSGERYESGGQFDSSIVYGYIDDEFAADKTMSVDETRKMFRRSFRNVGHAFEHSNWVDARLPKFLKELLDQQSVSTTMAEPPCAPNPYFIMR
jgi:hypothetical protein